MATQRFLELRRDVDGAVANHSAVGLTWDNFYAGKHVKRQVRELISREGQERFVVVREGSNVAEYVPPSDLSRLVAVEQTSYEDQVAKQEREVAEAERAREEARAFSLTRLGRYLATISSPLKRAKSFEALKKQVICRANVCVRHELVERLVDEGYTQIFEHPTEGVILSDGETWYRQADLTKTALDYASFLIGA